MTPEFDITLPPKPWWTRWKLMLVGVVIALPFAVIAYYLVLVNDMANRDSLLSQIAGLHEQNVKNKEIHDNHEAFEQHAAEVDARYAELTERIPEVPQREILADEVQTMSASIAKESGGRDAIRLTFFDTDAPRAIQPDMPGLASLSAVSVHMTFRGNWTGFRALMDRFRAAPRTIETTSYTMTIKTDQPDASETIYFAVEGQTFFKRFTAKLPAPPPPAPPA